MRSIISKVTCLVALLICFGAAASARGQESQIPTPDCPGIADAGSPLFITFERTESKKVFLRLRNHSRCPVLIPTNQLSAPVRIVKQPNGGLKMEQTEELKDGSQVPVVYHLFKRRESKGTVGVSDGCVILTWRLLPQQSIVFAIPPDDFRRHADVGVEFSYLSEVESKGDTGIPPRQIVYFRSESLPKGVVR